MRSTASVVSVTFSPRSATAYNCSKVRSLPLTAIVMNGSAVRLTLTKVKSSQESLDIFPARAWACHCCRKSRAAFRRRQGVPDRCREKLRTRIESRSEEHTSELQSRQYLVCRLLLEKKKQQSSTDTHPHVRTRVSEHNAPHKHPTRHRLALHSRH